MHSLKTPFMVIPSRILAADAKNAGSPNFGSVPTMAAPVIAASPAYTGSRILHSPVYLVRI